MAQLAAAVAYPGLTTQQMMLHDILLNMYRQVLLSRAEDPPTNPELGA